MKASLLLAAASAASVSTAISIPAFSDVLNRLRSQTPLATQEQFLIELSPDEQRWVTEDEKWQLRRDGQQFFDITDSSRDYPDLVSVASKKQPVYPEKTQQDKKVTPLLKELKKENMREHLETFTSFHTRYYKSDYGRQSSEWLLDQVNQTLAKAGAGYVQAFPHSWGQNSIIATLPGKTNKTVVIGAHQDSINLFLPSLLAAPGADDDGSGTVTILEALRVLVQDKDIVKEKQENTIEFQWYSAEEGGLLGSQAIFNAYAAQGRDVRAMLQQDSEFNPSTELSLCIQCLDTDIL